MSSKKLLIVAGESSGELYGGLLACQLKDSFELIGIGGKYMQAAGVSLIGNITHAFGAFEVVGHFKKIKENFKAAESALESIDGLILIDFPDFNLKLATKAKKLNKKVLYYVSPQIWAWRKGRIKKIKECVDFMATILPFEEDIYKKAKIPSKFVGHPMYELMNEELGYWLKVENTSLGTLRENLRKKFNITKNTVITLMPGSRPSEIKRKISLMVNIIKTFDRDKIHFLIPKAPNIEFSEEIKQILSSFENLTILNEQAFTALAMSDLAVITSGTSTLQAALLQIPMIVIYKVNPCSYFIGKILIKGVKHIALPNVIADFTGIEDIRIPEFIQHLDVKKITEEIDHILCDEDYRKKTSTFLSKISKFFEGKEASKEVAAICKQLF